jgi:hypothetical protein
MWRHPDMVSDLPCRKIRGGRATVPEGPTAKIRGGRTAGPDGSAAKIQGGPLAGPGIVKTANRKVIPGCPEGESQKILAPGLIQVSRVVPDFLVNRKRSKPAQGLLRKCAVILLRSSVMNQDRDSFEATKKRDSPLHNGGVHPPGGEAERSGGTTCYPSWGTQILIKK